MEARPCEVLPPLEAGHSSEGGPEKDLVACAVMLFLEAEGCSDPRLSLAW